MRAFSGRELSEILDPMEFVVQVLTHIPDPNRHTIQYFDRYTSRSKPKSNQDSTSPEVSDDKESAWVLPALFSPNGVIVRHYQMSEEDIDELALKTGHSSR